MNDIQLRLMTGVDIPIPELSLVIHPPTIREIGMMGEAEFFSAAQYLCLDKELLVQDETLLQSITNFQILMGVLSESKDKTKKISVATLLNLLFPTCHVVIMPKSIVITTQQEGQEPYLIDDNNFEFLQDAVKNVLCMSSLYQGQNIVHNPKGDRAKEIARKMAVAREKIAKQKAEKGTQESVLTRYLSILIVGKIVSVHDGANLNLFQLFDLMERYDAFQKWDADFRVRLAGGKPEKQVEAWTRNLYSVN